MAAEPLFAGLLLLLWLGLGLAGWLIATLRLRPRASLVALCAAEGAAIIGGALPALAGWRDSRGLLCGLALVFAGASITAWQVTRRRQRPPCER